MLIFGKFFIKLQISLKVNDRLFYSPPPCTLSHPLLLFFLLLLPKQAKQPRQRCHCLCLCWLPPQLLRRHHVSWCKHTNLYDCILVINLPVIVVVACSGFCRLGETWKERGRGVGELATHTKVNNRLASKQSCRNSWRGITVKFYDYVLLAVSFLSLSLHSFNGSTHTYIHVHLYRLYNVFGDYQIDFCLAGRQGKFSLSNCSW